MQILVVLVLSSIFAALPFSAVALPHEIRLPEPDDDVSEIEEMKSLSEAGKK